MLEWLRSIEQLRFGRVWSKNTHLLLVRVQTPIATIKIKVIVSQEDWKPFISVSNYITLRLYAYASFYHRAACSSMFIAVLFIAIRNWNQPRCSTTEEQIKKLYIHTVTQSLKMRSIIIMIKIIIFKQWILHFYMYNIYQGYLFYNTNSAWAFLEPQNSSVRNKRIESSRPA